MDTLYAVSFYKLCFFCTLMFTQVINAHKSQNTETLSQNNTTDIEGPDYYSSYTGPPEHVKTLFVAKDKHYMKLEKIPLEDNFYINMQKLHEISSHLPDILDMDIGSFDDWQDCLQTVLALDNFTAESLVNIFIGLFQDFDELTQLSTWSPWPEWDQCDGICTKTMQFIIRHCITMQHLRCTPGVGRVNRTCWNADLCEDDVSATTTELPDSLNVTGTYSWSEWSACSNSCGQGHQFRQRVNPNTMATEKTVQTCVTKCPAEITTEVPDNLNMDDPYSWTKWSACSSSCGHGHRFRQRLGPNSTNLSTEKDVQNCVTQCPDSSTNHRTSDPYSWTVWSVCSVSCGQGQQFRQRLISNTTDFSLQKTLKRCFTTCPSLKKNLSLSCYEEKNEGVHLMMKFILTVLARNKTSSHHRDKQHQLFTHKVAPPYEFDEKTYHCLVTDGHGGITGYTGHNVVVCDFTRCNNHGVCFALVDNRRRLIDETCECQDYFNGKHCQIGSASESTYWLLFIVLMTVMTGLVLVVLCIVLQHYLKGSVTRRKHSEVDCDDGDDYYDSDYDDDDDDDTQGLNKAFITPTSPTRNVRVNYKGETPGLLPYYTPEHTQNYSNNAYTSHTSSHRNACSHNNKSDSNQPKGLVDKIFESVCGICCGKKKSKTSIQSVVISRRKHSEHMPRHSSEHRSRYTLPRQSVTDQQYTIVEKVPRTSNRGINQKNSIKALKKAASKEAGCAYFNSEYITFLGRNLSDLEKKPKKAANMNVNANTQSSMDPVVVYSGIFGKMMGTPMSEQSTWMRESNLPVAAYGREHRKENGRDSFASNSFHSKILVDRFMGHPQKRHYTTDLFASGVASSEQFGQPSATYSKQINNLPLQCSGSEYEINTNSNCSVQPSLASKYSGVEDVVLQRSIIFQR